MIGGCTNSGAVKGVNYAGGIAGETATAIVENCQNTVEVSGSSNIGGITGRAANGYIVSCGVGASVSGDGDSVGGITGSGESNTISNSSLNTGISVTGGSNVGGIVGSASNDMMTNCYVPGKGTITGRGENTGGIVGYYAGEGDLRKCTNNNIVSGKQNTGGLLGGTDISSSVGLYNCSNCGDVSGEDFTGGITGLETNSLIIYCANSGKVEGKDNVGGIIGASGFSGAYHAIDTTYNLGAVSGKTNVGGAAGQNKGHITDVYNVGTVTGEENVGGIAGQDENNGQPFSGVFDGGYNYGAVMGNTNVGGIFGISRGSIKDVYYLSTAAQSACGSGDSSGTEAIDKQQFESLIERLQDYAWKQSPILGRPILVSNPEIGLSGTGTPEDPYLISEATMITRSQAYSTAAVTR